MEPDQTHHITAISDHVNIQCNWTPKGLKYPCRLVSGICTPAHHLALALWTESKLLNKQWELGDWEKLAGFEKDKWT